MDDCSFLSSGACSSENHVSNLPHSTPQPPSLARTLAENLKSSKTHETQGRPVTRGQATQNGSARAEDRQCKAGELMPGIPTLVFATL